MLIYNITLKIDWAIYKEWLQWMKEIYITAIMSTGCFSRHQFVRLLEVDEDEGPAYALQLYAVKKEDYLDYIQTYLPQIETVSYEKWRNNVLSFSTLMEVIE